MNAYKLLVLLATNFALETTMADENEESCATVFERHEASALINSVINSSHVFNEMECGIKCMKNDTCQSFNCQTGGYHGNRLCELSNQTRHSKPVDLKKRDGFTYFGIVPVSCLRRSETTEQSYNCHPGYKGPRCLIAKLGHVIWKPGHSCKDIRDSGDATGDGEYWIDPEKNGNPLKVFCDMTTDEGGWLLVANFVMSSSILPPDWSAETSYRGISNYYNNRMGISNCAMSQLRTHISFTQLRFHCSKQKGYTFHVTTANNNTGEAVVQFFSGQTDTLPYSCQSFVKMADDNSRLATKCAKWGNDREHYVGKWGHYNVNNERRMYDHAAFVAHEHHWVIVRGSWKCDDAETISLSPGDFWKIYVR